MKVPRRAFMGLAGSSLLAAGLPAPLARGSSDAEAKTDRVVPARVELEKISFFEGREYFVLRSGRAEIIFQWDRANVGPAFQYMLFDAEDSRQSAKKETAFNFDPETAFAASALQVELGGFAFCAFGTQTDCRLLDIDGVPTIEARWWAGGVGVTERVFAFHREQAIQRTILLDGSGLAGNQTVSVRLFLPPGQFREHGRSALQSGKGYASGLVAAGAAAVNVNQELGYMELGPFTVGPHESASCEVVNFFEIPYRDGEALRRRAALFTTKGLEKERQETEAAWALVSSVTTGDETVHSLYEKARFGLNGMIAENGTMDAGIFEYGAQWVRDTSHSALGALHCGHFELARAALARVLDRMVSAEGATAVAGAYSSPDLEELDQMGELLHALKGYWDWTGDDSLFQEHSEKILAVIQRPLLPIFRDETGMVHNRREFWERTFDDAYELAYQTYLVVGLRDAADLAGPLRAEGEAAGWRKEANRTLKAMLSHPTRALVADGHLIKRRSVTGEIVDRVPGHGYRPDAPMNTEKYNLLDSDSSMALPIALGIVDSQSPLSLKTLDLTEELWNMRWTGGGYERYNSSSEPDTPGPWPFASCFILRALHESSQFDRSRRVLEWLNTVQGGRSGFWFEEIPLLRSTPSACGVIPWTSAEVALFVVRHLLGVRFEGKATVIKPRPYPGSPPVSADLRLRSGRLRLQIEGWGMIQKADLDGIALQPRPDNSITLPENFTSGTLKIGMGGPSNH